MKTGKIYLLRAAAISTGAVLAGCTSSGSVATGFIDVDATDGVADATDEMHLLGKVAVEAGPIVDGDAGNDGAPADSGADQ